MPQSVPGLILTSTGDIKTARISIQTEQSGCQLSDLQKYLKRKTVPEKLGSYPWKKHTLQLYGYKDGKAGTENKHELPPPLDNQLYFGDIVILNCKEDSDISKPMPLTTEEYEQFYTQMFEGFEDIENEEEQEEEGDEELDEFENEDEGFEEGDEDKDEENEFEEDDEKEPEPEELKLIDDEEEILPVQRKRAGKSKSKSKVKDVPLFFLGGDEKELVESTSFENPPTEPHRVAVLRAIDHTLKALLPGKQQLELEHYIYNNSLEVASKKHIHRSWKQPLFVKIYVSTARSVVGNLHPSNYVQNKTLYARFKAGEVSLEEIASFTFSDLYPEMWKELSFRQFEREKRLLEGNKSMATDQFFCKRCKKRECTYYEMQTRSADEPMTIFIQCVNCGKQWRQ